MVTRSSDCLSTSVSNPLILELLDSPVIPVRAPYDCFCAKIICHFADNFFRKGVLKINRFNALSKTQKWRAEFPTRQRRRLSRNQASHQVEVIKYDLGCHISIEVSIIVWRRLSSPNL